MKQQSEQPIAGRKKHSGFLRCAVDLVPARRIEHHRKAGSRLPNLAKSDIAL
jgi:hypothetical protein